MRNSAMNRRQASVGGARETKMIIKNLSVALLALFAIVTAAPESRAASAREIDAGVHETLDRFFHKIGGARELAHKAVGILVFP